MTKMMTSKRRFKSGILGGRVDRPPVGSVTSVATVEQMELTGAFFPDAHLDGAKMATLAAGSYEILGYDAIMPYFSVTQQPGSTTVLRGAAATFQITFNLLASATYTDTVSIESTYTSTIK